MNQEGKKMLVEQLQRMLQQVEGRHMVGLKNLEVTTRQVLVMQSIVDFGSHSPSQTELIAKTGVDRSTLSDLIRRLNKKGLITRKRDKDDARAYRVSITADGKSKLKSARKVMEKIEATETPAAQMLMAAIERSLAPPAKLAAAG